MLNKTIRSTSDQRSLLWHFIAAFNCLWNRSTKLFAAGWYAVVRKCVVPSKKLRWLNKWDSNYLSWSVVTLKGVPKRATHPATNALATVSASMLSSGKTSGHRVKRSTHVKQYLFPRDTGNGPTRSMWTCSNLVHLMTLLRTLNATSGPLATILFHRWPHESLFY